MNPVASLPLQGLRVVEFAHVVAGPFAGLQLQQMGAEVIKVERPGAGDFLASVASGQRTYQALTAGKQVQRIDLNQPEGLQQALALVRKADVLIDSFAPGALARKGLDYESLSRAQPRLVYCSISGYGSQDPLWGPRGAYDHVVQAMTGIARQNGVEGDPPIKVGFPLVDTATASTAVTAVLGALLARERSGHGQYIEVSMARVALQLLFPMACEAALTGIDSPRIGNRGYTGSPGSAFFECADGWLALGANTDEQMRLASAALGIEGMGPADQQAVPHGTPASAIAVPLYQALSKALRVSSSQQAEERLVAAGVPVARLRSLAEFIHEAVKTGWLADGDGSAAHWAAQMALGWRSFAPSHGKVDDNADDQADRLIRRD